MRHKLSQVGILIRVDQNKGQWMLIISEICFLSSDVERLRKKREIVLFFITIGSHTEFVADRCTYLVK